MKADHVAAQEDSLALPLGRADVSVTVGHLGQDPIRLPCGGIGAAPGQHPSDRFQRPHPRQLSGVGLQHLAGELLGFVEAIEARRIQSTLG